MKACRFPVAFLVLVSVSASIPCACAGTVPIVLFNTGVADDGTPLPRYSLDTNYTVISSPDPSFLGNAYTTVISAYVVSSLASWIAPGTGIGCPGGLYTYRTTFILPDTFNPLTDTASITGMWASDNNGVNIWINGVGTGNYILYGNGTPTDPWSFQVLSPFSVGSGFKAGLNTLDFEIEQDGGSPTGILVQMTGEYESTAVPEPSLLPLLGLGLIAVIVCSRRYGRGQ